MAIAFLNMFMNILGNAMGAAILGGILNIKLTSYLKGVTSEKLNVDVINVLLTQLREGHFPKGL